MRFHFTSPRLAARFGSQEQLIRSYGNPCAKQIIRRMVQLAAAAHLEELGKMGGRCHELKGDRQGQLALDLKHPLRLILEPEPPVPLKPDGGLDWKRVTAVIIVEVVDYHD